MTETLDGLGVDVGGGVVPVEVVSPEPEFVPAGGVVVLPEEEVVPPVGEVVVPVEGPVPGGEVVPDDEVVPEGGVVVPVDVLDD